MIRTREQEQTLRLTVTPIDTGIPTFPFVVNDLPPITPDRDSALDRSLFHLSIFLHQQKGFGHKGTDDTYYNLKSLYILTETGSDDRKAWDEILRLQDIKMQPHTRMKMIQKNLPHITEKIVSLGILGRLFNSRQGKQDLIQLFRADTQDRRDLIDQANYLDAVWRQIPEEQLSPILSRNRQTDAYNELTTTLFELGNCIPEVRLSLLKSLHQTIKDCGAKGEALILQAEQAIQKDNISKAYKVQLNRSKNFVSKTCIWSNPTKPLKPEWQNDARVQDVVDNWLPSLNGQEFLHQFYEKTKFNHTARWAFDHAEEIVRHIGVPAKEVKRRTLWVQLCVALAYDPREYPGGDSRTASPCF